MFSANPVAARAPITFDGPLSQMPPAERPMPPATPSPSRPAQRVPDTIDGYATAFSRTMMGPSGPVPSTEQALRQEPLPPAEPEPTEQFDIATPDRLE